MSVHLSPFLIFLCFHCTNILLQLFVYFTTICANIKIFISLRDNQIHGQNHFVQGQSSQANALNIARYRKAVYSALWVQVTLVIFYLPYSIAVAFRTRQGGMLISTYLAREFTATLVFLNSSLNPFLYCWKITEVRQAVNKHYNYTSVPTKTWTKTYGIKTTSCKTSSRKYSFSLSKEHLLTNHCHQGTQDLKAKREGQNV